MYKKEYTAFFLFLAVAIWPIFATTTLPLYDYPNHLARMHVLANWETSQSLQQFYVVRWSSLSNLAMDLFVPPLSSVVGVETAGKIFIVLTFLAMAGGTMFLHRAVHGRLSAYPLLAFLFLYNSILLFGFMNYLFSVGIFLIFVALWIRLSDRPWLHRLIIFSVCTTVLFYMHLYGLGLYSLVVISYEASKSWSSRIQGGQLVSRDWIATLGQFVLPLLIFIVLSPVSDAVQLTSFGDLLNKWHFYQKEELLRDLFSNYNGPFDFWSVGALAATLLGGLALRRIAFGPHMFFPVLVLFVAFMLMPKTVFSSWAADEKFPIALALLFIAATDWRVRSPVMKKLVVIGFAFLFLTRTAIVTDVWQTYDEGYQEFRTAIAKMPEGARMTAAIAYRGTEGVMRRPSLNHLGNLLVIERDGFFSTFFSNPSQQPVHLRPPYNEIAKRYRDVAFRNFQLEPEFLCESRNPFAVEVLRHYDFILVVREHWFNFSLPDNLIPVHTGSIADFTLYQIDNSREPLKSGCDDLKHDQRSAH